MQLLLPVDGESVAFLDAQKSVSMTWKRFLLGFFRFLRLYQCSYGFVFNYACRLLPLGTQFSERENGSH